MLNKLTVKTFVQYLTQICLTKHHTATKHV